MLCELGIQGKLSGQKDMSGGHVLVSSQEVLVPQFCHVLTALPPSKNTVKYLDAL